VKDENVIENPPETGDSPCLSAGCDARHRAAFGAALELAGSAGWETASRLSATVNRLNFFERRIARQTSDKAKFKIELTGEIRAGNVERKRV
jgi:hypothetical protein